MSNPFDTFGTDLQAALPPPSAGYGGPTNQTQPPSYYGNGVGNHSMNASVPPMGGSPYGYSAAPPPHQYSGAAPSGNDYGSSLDNPFTEPGMPAANHHPNNWGAPPVPSPQPAAVAPNLSLGAGDANLFGSAPLPAPVTGMANFGMQGHATPAPYPSYGGLTTDSSFGGSPDTSNPYAPSPPTPQALPFATQDHHQKSSYGAPPPPVEQVPLNPYGDATTNSSVSNAHGVQTSNPYGPPASNPYGPPTTNPYGPPPMASGSSYGASPPEHAPAGNPYGAPPPQPNPYGAPQLNPYGAPMEPASVNPYGPPPVEPAVNPYGAPPVAPYGAPPQDPSSSYGQGIVPYGGPPSTNPYGIVAPGFDPSGGGALVVSQHQNYAYGGYGPVPPPPPVDPFSVFMGTSQLPPLHQAPAAFHQATAATPAFDQQQAAPAPPSDDDFWGTFGSPQSDSSLAPPAAAAAQEGTSEKAPPEEEKKGEDGLPPGGEWYDARIFTPTLGVMFFKPQELTDSLFLNTDKEIVDGLGDRPVVAFIVEGSSARSAGVELGHVLLKVNGVDVRSPKEASRLIKEGPRPLPLLFYVPSTDVVIAEGEHMVKYDTRETTAPNSAKDWKPKYVVIGGIIAQPWMMNMYRSKSEYDIAVIETQARRPVSVKVKQFSLQGSRIQNDWQGPQMVKYKNKLHPWKFIVVLPVGRNPIKISSPNLSQLKPVHEGIRRVLLAQQRGSNRGGGHSSQQYDQRSRSHDQEYHESQQQNQYAHHAHSSPIPAPRQQQQAYGY